MLDETIVLKIKKGDYKWFEEINYMKNIMVHLLYKCSFFMILDDGCTLSPIYQ